MRFESLQNIDKSKVLSYIQEAIENQKLAKELQPERKHKIVAVPEILKEAFGSDPDFEKNFQLLSPGKQREYIEYVDTGKRSATKVSRLHKIKPMILKGIGLYDKYKKC